MSEEAQLATLQCLEQVCGGAGRDQECDQNCVSGVGQLDARGYMGGVVGYLDWDANPFRGPYGVENLCAFAYPKDAAEYEYGYGYGYSSCASFGNFNAVNNDCNRCAEVARDNAACQYFSNRWFFNPQSQCYGLPIGMCPEFVRYSNCQPRYYA